jgi:hypothetical protein
MIRLVIEDIDADVLQTETIVGEYAIANIGDISKRAGARSISFKLPKTANNKAIFESCEIPTSASDKPYKRLKARLYVDGVDMGMLFTTLENVNEFYNIRLFGGNSDLFATLKDLKLADLDLRQYNHHWATEYLSQTTVFGHPIQYAVIDWNMDSPNTAISNVATDVYMGAMLPCVYENFLVEKVFNEAGYTLDNQLLLEPVMQERSPVIPLGSKAIKRDNNFSRYLAKVQLQDGNFVVEPLLSSWAGTNIIEQSEYYWTMNNITNPNYASRVFFIADKGVYKVKLKFEYKITSGTYTFKLGYSDDNNTINPLNLSTYQFTINATTSWQQFEEELIFELNGDYSFGSPYNVDNIRFIAFVWFGSITLPVNIQLANATMEIISAEPLDGGTNIIYDQKAFALSYITIASCLPDFTQADFIKEYLKKYGSIININERTKVATIVPFKRLADNIGQAVDWSGKVDFSEIPNTEFTLGYAQRNVFKYKDDDDVVKPPFTDYTLEINDNTLEFEKVVIESKYSATETVERLIGRQIPQIKCFENYEFKKASKPRCLYIAAETGTLNYRKFLGSTSGQFIMTGTNVIPYCYFIREAFPHGLGFGYDLVDKFYTYLFGIIDKAKKYELPIRLNTLDISTFDFLKPVYIAELDGYFYVNKFKFEYTSKKSSIVELIKLL